MLSKRKEEIKPIVTNARNNCNESVTWAYEHFRTGGGEDPPLDKIPLTRTPTPIPPIEAKQKYKH